MQFFADDYSAVPAGNVSLTSAWTSRGYSDFENSGTPANVAVIARASLPAGLLANINFPTHPSKRALCFTLAANEVQARLLWSNFPAGVRTVSVAWWEYRDSGNLGGEKFCRVGNFIAGPGSNRGVDSIITLGQVSATTLIANSANMHAYADQSLSPGISGWPGLHHFEAVYALSTGTGADGSVSLYQDGALIGQATGLRFFDTSGQAATGIQLWDQGGWSSTGGGTEGTVTYPIVRYFCEVRIASARQGVWAMSSGAPAMIITGVRTLTAPLAGPALSSSVSGSTATLSWTPPTPTGQSVIVGYRVYRSSTLAGTYTQVGAALPPTQLSLADTLSGTQFYKVEAFDQFVTGNRSAGQQCVPVTGQRLNFNPSIAYWQLDRNASYQTNINRMASLKAACPPTQGFEITLTWGAVENPALVGGAAQYDGSWATGDQTIVANQRGFRLIDSFIAAAAAVGCQCCIVIRGLGGHSNGGDQSSTNYPTSFPAYTKAPAYGTVSPATNGLWGAAWVNSYGATNPNPGSNGVQFQWYIRWWDTRVAALLKAYGAAFGARYNSNPRVEWFSFAADEMTVSDATGYSDSQAITALTGSTGLLASLRASMPQIPVRVYYNYFDLLATMDTLLAEAVLRDCSVGGPDTCVDKPVVSADPAKNSDGRFRSITALWRWLRLTASAGNGGVTDVNAPIYVGQGDYICEVENEDLAYDTLTNTIISSDGRALGDGIPYNIVATANSLGACRMCWVDNVADGPSTNRTNTAHPNLCDWLSSAAQGGNVNVNGAVAGISLTNTTYPPTWPQ